MRIQNKTKQKTLSNTLKAVIGGKFIALSACIKKSKRKQLNGLILHLIFFFCKTRTNQIQTLLMERNNKNQNRHRRSRNTHPHQ